MSQFFSLPDALLASLLSNWLTIDDIVRIDSALCNTKLRQAFICIAYQPGVTLKYTDEILNAGNDFCDAMNEWIFTRSASVDGIRTTEVFWERDSDRQEYLIKHGHAIRWVKYVDETESSGSQTDESLDCSSEIRSAVDVAKYCPNLKQFWSDCDLDSSVTLALAENCPLLEELNIQEDSCDNACVAAIAKRCSKLTTVNLVNFDGLSERSLVALVRSNPGLVDVAISTVDITSKFLRKLAWSCRGLYSLFLGADDLDLCAVYHLLKHCRKLSCLTLCSCSLSRSEEISGKIKSHSLRHLHLSAVGITEAELEGLLRACPDIICVQLDACETPLDLGNLHLGTHCRHLQELHLMEKNSTGGDAMLRSVSKHCTDLRMLNACPNTSVTDVGLCAVARMCPLLDNVCIGTSPAVTDAFLAALAQYSHHLTDLLSEHCPGVTRAGLEGVLRGCPALAKLAVAQELVSGEGWEQEMKERYPNLQEVRHCL